MEIEKNKNEGKRKYNLALTRQVKELVKKNVPGDIREKISRKHIGDKDKARILHLLAVLIELSDKNKAVKISLPGLGEYLHMKHGYIGKACEKLEEMKLISRSVKKGGTLYELCFDLENEVTPLNFEVGEDGVERLVKTISSKPEVFTEEEAEASTSETVVEYGVEEVLNVVKSQEDIIDALTDKNNELIAENSTLKGEIDSLKTTISRLKAKLKAEDDKKKIMEATQTSPQIGKAFTRTFKLSNLWTR